MSYPLPYLKNQYFFGYSDTMPFLKPVSRSITMLTLFGLFLSQMTSPLFAQSPSPNTQNPPAQQQNTDSAASLGVARIVDSKEKNPKDGSILSSSEGGNILANIPYDGHVLGVVARDAAIVLNATGNDGVPVISTGTVYVLTSGKEGAIKKNDLLTTSTTPGVAVKATKSGYVIGTALEDYSSNDANLIAVNLDLHYFNSKPTFPGTLTDIFKIAILPTKEGPTPILKYIVAGGVVLGSLVLGFVSFGRTAAKGVEALGRNPAASKIIHLGIMFNVAIVVMIGLVGLTIGFLILRL